MDFSGKPSILPLSILVEVITEIIAERKNNKTTLPYMSTYPQQSFTEQRSCYYCKMQGHIIAECEIRKHAKINNETRRGYQKY